MTTPTRPSFTPEAVAATNAAPLLIFVGGGSGGHIYPGLAIADAIGGMCQPGAPARIVFVPSERAIDARILESVPYPVDPSPARPMIARPMGMLRFLRGWLAARRHARGVLTDRAWPAGRVVHVVAMGGFVAAPFVSVARSLGIGVTMVNLDAVPGKANRYIARHADRVFTAAPVTAANGGGTTWIEVPPVIRCRMRFAMLPSEARAALNLDPDRPVLAVSGGSQGLRSLNEFVQAFAASERGQRTLRDGRWQVLHQTGRNLDDAARAAYARAGVDATVVPFTDMLLQWYRAADAAVCTAGAGTIGELWAIKAPALLMPYPHHRDQHQRFNAAPLVDAGGALLGRDCIDADANLAENGAALESLLADPRRRAFMRANLENLGPADGAERIARALLDTIRAGSPHS